MCRFALSLLHALVRRTWLLASITIVCCAAFAAHAATALVDAGYLAPLAAGPLPTGAPRPAPPPRPPPRVRPEGSQLVERNMFCSSCAPASSAGPAILALPPAQLIAIDINHEPRATVRVIASEVQGSWGIGDAIAGLGHVDRIGPTWIDIVDDAGRRGRISLRDPAAGPGEPIDRGPPASGCGAVAEAWIDRIRKLDDQTYEVDRALVRELVTGVSRSGSVRGVPIVERGEIKGVRLLGITPCTLAAELGLKSGDMLAAIDGAPLRNAQQLFDLYARLDELSVVELSGTRAGKPLIRTLRLR